MTDYSETIIKYSQLEAYSLPKIEELENTVIKYQVYSTIDLLPTYHLVPLSEKDHKFTAFEADGK